MALLQPPPEVYDLFDDIMLLSEGMPGFCLFLTSSKALASQYISSGPCSGLSRDWSREWK